jgi:TetR/AcrR family transcriptional regulator
MNQLLERIEASLRQSLRVSVSQGEMAPDLDTSARAALAVAFVLGRWHRFAKSGFRKQATDGLETQLITLIGAAT